MKEKYTNEQLIKLAQIAEENSYSTYSHFVVGQLFWQVVEKCISALMWRM